MMLSNNCHFRFMGGFLRAAKRRKNGPAGSVLRPSSLEMPLGDIRVCSELGGGPEMQGDYFIWRIKNIKNKIKLKRSVSREVGEASRELGAAPRACGRVVCIPRRTQAKREAPSPLEFPK